ncbi:MAG: hypothetical protein ACREFX_13125 [Opitutaceae bacterium]
MMKVLPRVLISLIVLAALGGCVTHITTNVTQNPPPEEKLSDFNHFELEPVVLASAYTSSEANHKAMAKVQADLSERMDPVIAKWNQAGEETGGANHTLVIEPKIEEIKFLNATVRVWTSSFSGSSAILMRVRLVDKDTDREVGAPIFYARAAAMGGAFSFGTTDNLMLVRITETISSYLKNNYGNAVGGPTGQHRRK